MLANMTLYAPDGLPIILMERFEGLTSAVDRKGDNGAMSLTFMSERTYTQVFQTVPGSLRMLTTPRTIV